MYNLYYLIGYNNYYNRKLKRKLTLEDYFRAVNNRYIENLNCYNFNPGDGVLSSTILNDLQNVNVISSQPDYLIVCDTNDVILQRWFVIDCDRDRGGQYKATIRRDVLVEAYDEWKKAPVFVEKAILDINDSAIFNHEQLTFSEIKKTRDDLITDKTEIPWIVGYGNFKNITEVTSWGTGSSTTPTSAEEVDINTLREEFRNSVTQVSSYSNIYTEMTIDNSYNVATFTYSGSSCKADIVDMPGDEYDELKVKTYSLLSNWTGSNVQGQLKNKFDAAMIGQGGFDNEFNSLKISKQTQVNRYLQVNNKFYRDRNTGIYYKGVLVTRGITSKARLYSDSYPTLYATIREVPDGVVGVRLNTLRDRSQAYTFDLVTTSYTVTFEEIGKSGGKVDFRNAKELNDAPYSMFFLPYGDTEIRRGQTYSAWGNKTANLMAATGIAQALKESGFIYDIQVLPYCPVQDFEYHNRKWIVNSNKYDVRTVTDSDDNVLTAIIFAEQSSGRFAPDFVLDDTYNYNKKIEYETKRFRLVSPNQNSIFEFSPTMIADYVEFEVQFTYKPYSPYIHIAPKFRGMYGLNQPEDQRGLICSGDFSIDMVSDQWATYELQNVNYNNIFNRQIESMELRNKISHANDVVGAIAGSGSGAGSGAAVGSAFGPVGMGVGAAVGGAISLGGGIADTALNSKLRNDALDLRHDMFDYEMGNIKARPITLSKISGFNTNSRYIPYLETYDCTDEELEALKNKIRYNGETVMRIDTPQNFFANKFYYNTSKYYGENYFKGKIIQLEVPGEDFHFANAVADELNKGVYIPLGGI